MSELNRLPLSNPYRVGLDNADFLSNLLGEKIGKDDDFYIFGAGSATKNLLHFLTRLYQLKIKGIIDNNQRSMYFSDSNITIYKPEDIDFSCSKILVLAPTAREDIVSQILALGGDLSNIHWPQEEPLKFYTHLYQWHFTEQELLARSNEILCALSLFEDDTSKDLFLHRLGILSGAPDYRNYKDFVHKFSYLINHTYPDMRMPENFFYFNNELICDKYSSFIDVGAYDGDSVHEFIKKSDFESASIICYEPDPRNFQELCANLSQYLACSNIILLQKAAWSSNTRLPFIPSEQSSVASCSKVDVSNISPTFVNAACIDELCINNQFGLIKFDIEGGEVEAIKGAKETIINNHYDLIVSAYNQKDDFITIPILIKNICPEYRLHMRLFSNSLLEMVVIAKKQRF